MILPIAAVEFDAADAVLVVVVLVLLAASAVLALAETSLVRMTRSKALSLLDADRRGAVVLVRLIEDPQGFLNPVILLVLICQLVVATLVGILAAAWFGALGVVVATVFEISAIFVLGEAVPKNWAVHHPERAALLSAPLVAALVGFWPVRWVSRALIGLANLVIGEDGAASESEITESELLAMADVALEEDVIETEERALIHSIIEFGDTVVHEVMVPRPDMVSLDAGMTVEAALDELLEAGFSRAPVVAGGVDDVVGVAYAKDLISALRSGGGAADVTRHMRGAHFVPEAKRVAALMREMQSETFHLAVVVDEYGGTAGLVTLEDLIEELVGEIVDEFDVEVPLIERLATGQVRVSARLGISEASDHLGIDLPAGSWDTIGGLVFDRLGHVPSEGETIEAGGRRLTVEVVTGRRIDRVVIDPAPPAPAPGEQR